MGVLWPLADCGGQSRRMLLTAEESQEECHGGESRRVLGTVQDS